MGNYKSNSLVIVGLGQIGTALLKRLSREYSVTCITLNEDAPDILKGMKREGVKLITADATSRLTLEKADVDDADAVIITTTLEEVNIEVARVLNEHFSPRRVISVALTMKGVESLEEMGVEVEDVFASGAMGIRNRLEVKARTPHAIGLGKDEILEVEVHPNSRLANKPIGIIDPIRWRVGIIYREGNIIIPRQDTILKPKDKIVILGDPVVLKTVSEILTFNFQKFPLQYGSIGLVYMDGIETESFIEEINYIFSVFPLQRILLLRGQKAQTPEYGEMIERIDVKNLEVKDTSLPTFSALSGELGESPTQYGMIMLSGALIDGSKSFGPGLGKKKRIKDLVSEGSCPLLIGRGTFPYEQAAVSCVGDIDVEHLMDTSFEISVSVNNELQALLSSPSKYISGEADVERFNNMKKAVSDMSLIHKSKVQTRVLEGNPVGAVLEAAKEFNLLVMDAAGIKKGGLISALLNPDPVWNIIWRSTVSTLLIPPIEEAL